MNVFLLGSISILTNSTDPDEMPHNAAFYLDLRCLPKYKVKGFRVLKDEATKLSDIKSPL